MERRTKPAGTVGKGGANPAPRDADDLVRVAAEQLVLIPIADLVPYAQNARTHSHEQIKQLRASLREFGFVMPLLIDFSGNVIAGHGRLLAAKAEGMTQVPCILVTNLTDAQRRAYILADNKLAENAEWDLDLVQVELEVLRGLDFQTDLTGFLPKELFGDAPMDAFEPPQQPEKPRGTMRAPKTCICPECGCEFTPGGKREHD